VNAVIGIVTGIVVAFASWYLGSEILDKVCGIGLDHLFCWLIGWAAITAVAAALGFLVGGLVFGLREAKK
jgi:hypothetical protein